MREPVKTEGGERHHSSLHLICGEVNDVDVGWVTTTLVTGPVPRTIKTTGFGSSCKDFFRGVPRIEM